MVYIKNDKLMSIFSFVPFNFFTVGMLFLPFLFLWYRRIFLEISPRWPISIALLFKTRNNQFLYQPIQQKNIKNRFTVFNSREVDSFSLFMSSVMSSFSSVIEIETRGSQHSPPWLSVYLRDLLGWMDVTLRCLPVLDVLRGCLTTPWIEYKRRTHLKTVRKIINDHFIYTHTKVSRNQQCFYFSFLYIHYCPLNDTLLSPYTTHDTQYDLTHGMALFIHASIILLAVLFIFFGNVQFRHLPFFRYIWFSNVSLWRRRYTDTRV